MQRGKNVRNSQSLLLRKCRKYFVDTAFGPPGFATLHCGAYELVVTPLDPDSCFDTAESDAQNNRNGEFLWGYLSCRRNSL